MALPPSFLGEFFLSLAICCVRLLLYLNGLLQ